MMMERVDSGSKVAEELRKKNMKVPIFLLSSIGNATASNIEIDKLGFNGVFQKPVDPTPIGFNHKKSSRKVTFYYYRILKRESLDGFPFLFISSFYFYNIIFVIAGEAARPFNR